MIKAVFFDIDNTLISHKIHGYPESTLTAFRKMHEKGILTFTATGRGYPELAELNLDELDFDGHVLLSGQLCLDRNGNVIYENPFPEEDRKILKEVFDRKEYSVMVDEKDRMYVNMVDDGLIEMQKTINSPIPAIGEYDGIKDVYEIVFFHKGQKLQETIDMFPHLKVTYWTENGVDMICSDGSKASGISHILEHYGITSEEMMAFGDANNDLEMLQMAGIGVCMGDGEEIVRNIADYVTETTENDGIYQALKHYCII